MAVGAALKGKKKRAGGVSTAECLRRGGVDLAERGVFQSRWWWWAAELLRDSAWSVVTRKARPAAGWRGLGGDCTSFANGQGGHVGSISAHYVLLTKNCAQLEVGVLQSIAYGGDRKSRTQH